MQLPEGMKKVADELGQDYSSEMHARVEGLAIDTKDTAEKIRTIVNRDFRDAGGPSYQGMRKEQV